MDWDTDGRSESPSLSSLERLSTCGWRETFFDTFKTSVIYDSKDILDLLLGHSMSFSPVLYIDSTPSQRPEIVEEIVKRLFEDCKDDVDAIKQAHKPEPDPDCPMDDEYRPEYAMYGPLKNIIQKISEAYESLVENPRKPWRASNVGFMDDAVSTTHLPRVFLDHAGLPLIADDPVYPNVFPVRPGFPLIEGRVCHVSGMGPFWRQCPAFLEVKAHDTDSPIPPGVAASPPAGTQLQNLEGSLHPADIWDERPLPSESLARCAEYARAILACRPFQLSVFGLILWGTNFAVAYFDRRGAVLSPAHSILERDGLRIFVRIILRMTWEMSDAELGRDPTVTQASDDPLNHADSLHFPRFVSRTAREHRMPPDTWMTIGRPLWCSPALLGRGTSVWWAVDREKNPVVLKTTWRSPSRLSERRIYDEIVKIVGGSDRLPRGMIRCGEITGGDVLLEGGAGGDGDPRDMLLTVDGIRGGHASTVPRGRLYGARGSGILHRIAFRDVGKPLWKFTCPEQLVRALFVALEAHKYLSEHGILHRDISAGNILIRVRPRVVDAPSGDIHSIAWDELPLELTEGFLTDFEFASLPGDTQHVDHGAEGADGMTGTMLFMSTELLRSISASRPLTRTTEQDLESFLWTLLYAVYKNAVEEGGAAGAGAPVDPLRRDFHRLFHAPSPSELVTSRKEFLKTVERGPVRRQERLFEYVSARSSKGENFYAVVHAAHYALEDSWKDDAASKARFSRNKARFHADLRGEPKAEVEDSNPINYDLVERVLKQFWKSNTTL